MNLDSVKPKELGEIPGSPENIKLKDFKAVSVVKNPLTFVDKAQYPVIDMHSHAWQKVSQNG